MQTIKAAVVTVALVALAACNANGGASADPLPLARGVYLEAGTDCSLLQYGLNPPPLEYLGDKFLSWVSGSSPVAFIATPITSAKTVGDGNHEVAPVSSAPPPEPASPSIRPWCSTSLAARNFPFHRRWKDLSLVCGEDPNLMGCRR